MRQQAGRLENSDTPENRHAYSFKMTSIASHLTYALITPARNEEAHLDLTVRSVLAQTAPPRRWVIVDDGSTDRTGEIAQRAAQSAPWIRAIRLPDHRDRTFAAKVQGFNAGYAELQGMDFDVVGNLDGDISFGPDYFEFLMEKFAEMPSLGVAGTPFREDNYHSAEDSYEGGRHVAGGCQLFRRRCFEEIGGYIPVRGGGIDWIAVTTARMKGWETRSFPEREFYHHRALGTASRSLLQSSFDYGVKDYRMGGHPLWELVRSAYRIAKKPYLLGGCALLAGYLSAACRRLERPVSDGLMQFHRREQMARLRSILGHAARLQRYEKY